jgi:hypothetical protein
MRTSQDGELPKASRRIGKCVDNGALGTGAGAAIAGAGFFAGGGVCAREGMVQMARIETVRNRQVLCDKFTKFLPHTSITVGRAIGKSQNPNSEEKAN